MSDIPDPQRLLCVGCGALFQDEGHSLLVCGECGHEQDRDELLHMYRYAADAYYYGHQYRHVYQGNGSAPVGVRFHIPFAGEVFAWIMLAALSGVIGNATYDTLKSAIRRVRDQVPATDQTQDFLPLLELTDDQLGDLLDSARVYANDLEGLTSHVRSAIIEEIAVDTMSHNPVLAAEMQKLMSRQNIKPKHRRRFAELLRIAIAERNRKLRQNKSHYASLWSRLPPT